MSAATPMFTLDPERLVILRQALVRLARPNRRWVSFAYLRDNELACLRNLAQDQEFRTARPQVNFRGRQTVQDFDICFPAPRVGAFDEFAHFLETGLYQAGKMMPQSPFCEVFRFNDFAIQRYAPKSRGIGIHRDGLRYRHIVVIVTLDGQSRLFATETRSGEVRHVIDDRPGRIVLLSASQFAGRDGEAARPLHGVDRVRHGRLSIGLRVEALEK